MGGRAGGGAGMGSGSRGRGDISMRGHSAALQKALKAEEESIRNLPKEHGAIFDENGKMIWHGSDQKDSRVWIPPYNAKDKVATHNHPDDSSLSRNDLIWATRADVSEMRAAGRNHSYYIKRPSGGWPSEKKIAEAYRNAKKNIEFRTDKYLKSQKMSVAAQRRAESIKWHRVNKEFARLTGIEYKAFRVK